MAKKKQVKSFTYQEFFNNKNLRDKIKNADRMEKEAEREENIRIRGIIDKVMD